MAKKQQILKTVPPKNLVQYQIDLVEAEWYRPDTGRALVTTFEKARRIGGSTAAAYVGTNWALGRRFIPNGGGRFMQCEPMDVYIVSKDYLGAKRLLREAAEASISLAALDPAYTAVPTATTLTFPNGRGIFALPCRPETIRGNTGAVIGDEVAFWRLMDETWAACKLVSGQTLGAAHGFPMLLVTTPWDSSSLACRLFTDDAFPFVRHRTDIYDAKRQGFPIDIEAARDELGIPELFATEMLCQWTHGGGSFFPLEKLRDCQEDDHEHRSGLPDGWQDAPARFGVDCGGGKGRDFTAVVQWRNVGGTWWMVGVKADNQTGTVDMADRAADWILDDVHGSVNVEVRADEGIMGADFIRHLAIRLRERKRTSIQGVGMNPVDQERYAIAGRRLLERGNMKIYSGTDAGGDDTGARALMLELSQLKARPGIGGRLTFVTPRDPTRGHLDRAWAGLIGLDEADEQAFPVIRPDASMISRLARGRFGSVGRGFG